MRSVRCSGTRSRRCRWSSWLDGAEHALHLEAVRERRRGLACRRDAPRRSPSPGGRSRARSRACDRPATRPGCTDARARSLDLGETLLGAGAAAVVELKRVEILEVERDRARGSGDLDAQRVLAAGREAGGLEDAQGAVVEAAGEQRDIVDRDGAELGSGRAAEARRMLSRTGARLTIVSRVPETLDEIQPGDELGEVDRVGADVAERAGAGAAPSAAARPGARSDRRASPAGSSRAPGGRCRCAPAATRSRAKVAAGTRR